MTKGWLKNKTRWNRKEAKGEFEHKPTFTEEHCRQLLKKIDSIQHYIGVGRKKDKFIAEANPQLNQFIKLRDKTLIILETLFFKRGSEVLRLKRKDVQKKINAFKITFNINKKRKRIKVCAICFTENGVRKIKHCRECGADITQLPIEYKEMGQKIKDKRLPFTNSFANIVKEYLNLYDKLNKNAESFLFPPYRVLFGLDVKIEWKGRKYFKKIVEKYPKLKNKRHALTVSQFNLILQRLDKTMTSCLFRYGGAERLLDEGLTPYELKNIGDWASIYMPERYAEKKGQTKAEREYTERLSKT